MATIQNARDVYLQAESPRLLPVTISNDFTFNGNIADTATVGSGETPASTVVTNAGNGATAFTGTENYRVDTAPTNAVSSASSPTVVNNNDGSRDITLTWTYTDGAVPADGFIIFYREGTGTVLSTDAGIQLPATARSFRFQGVHQGTAYRAGIAAFRRTEAGLRITSIYQPTSAPDWRVSATTVNITADINGMSSSTLTSRATSGYDIQQKLEAGGSVILTGQVVPINAGGFKVGTIAWNTTTGALLSGTGIAITEFGIIGASAGVETFTINALTGAPTYKGDITGGANIDITGKGVFGGGSVSGGIQAAIHANTSYNADYGIQAFSGALVGSSAVIGYSANGYGVRGEAQSSGGYGVKAGNAYGGVALVVGGKMTISSTTLVANLNADMVDGYEASALAKLSGGNTWSGGQYFGADIDVNGYVQCNNLRIDQTATTGTATATFPGNNKPGSNTICAWLPININGEAWRFPVWKD